MEDQTGRIALVTGGEAVMGQSIAAELARRGWSVCLQHDGPPEAAQAAVSHIQSAADQAGRKVEIETFAADLTLSAQREQLVEHVIETFQRIDMLVNAPIARASTPEDLLEMTEGSLREVMDASLTAAMFLTQQVANEMVRMVEAAMVENPKIVTINSISASATSVDHGPHCLARAALAMMTQLFADRLGEDGINVYEVRVGLISTGKADPAHARYEELIRQGLTPIRRWGRPGDVARAVAAVAEDMLGFSTGEVINVDGGFHLRRL